MTRLDVRAARGLIRLYEGVFKQRPVFRYWQQLEASQWWPAARVEALRVERLRELLRRAADETAFYADAWRRLGLEPSSVRCLDDLTRWPVVDRETIRAHRMAMRSQRSGMRLISKATGGSSGVPLQFDLDTDSNERRMAAWHRGYGWAGAAPGTRQWYLWGVPPAAAGAWKHRKVRLYDRLYRRTTVSCFELGDATVERFLASLRRARPDAIVAYTNALYTFARALEARGVQPPSPGSLIVGAEKLHDFQRAAIERVFGAPVFETYGSREFMLIGAECERHDGLHLTAEHLIVELLDDAGRPVPAGLEGNVVITDLTNHGMPFIRYANGDRAVMAAGTCACGRGLPRLRAVTGRQLDVLTLVDGRRLPGEFFPHIMKERSKVRQFQVVQEQPEVIRVRVVAPGWDVEDDAWLRHEVAAAAGGEVPLHIEPVEAIALTGAGKLQVVVNRLAHAGGGRAS